MARLNREINATLGAPAVREALADQAFEPGDLAPQAFARLMQDDAARWRKVIVEAGLKPE